MSLEEFSVDIRVILGILVGMIIGEELRLQNPVLIIDHEYDNMLNYQDNNMET